MTDGPMQRDDDLISAVTEWRKAQVLYFTPAWRGRPQGRHFSETLSLRRDLEAKLVEHLFDENQLVVAYSLLTLDLMGSDAIGKLPKTLLERREKVTTRAGSFSETFELGALASHIQKRWLTKK